MQQQEAWSSHHSEDQRSSVYYRSRTEFQGERAAAHQSDARRGSLSVGGSVQLFAQAEDEAKRMRDEYTSTEHLLLALSKSDEMSQILHGHGINYDDILNALQSIPRRQRITSQGSEST